MGEGEGAGWSGPSWPTIRRRVRPGNCAGERVSATPARCMQWRTGFHIQQGVGPHADAVVTTGNGPMLGRMAGVTPEAGNPLTTTDPDR